MGTREYLFLSAFCISAFYSIPSFYVTYRVAEAILRRPVRLSSSFFKVFLHDRLLSLTFFTFGMVFIRLPMTGVTTMLLCRIPPNFVVTIIYVIFYYLNYAAIYSTLAISILRVSAVLRPMEYDALQKPLSWILVISVYLLPVVTTWFLVPAMSYYTPLSVSLESASVTINYVKVFPEWRSSLALVFVTSLTCGFDLICFFITILGWRTLISRL
ncbi:hypothetical protein GCK32_018444 [Trichostrongylus colubriformis]|uniref:Serpentine receptor class gamma n=1 Tax=Trichostrongylus colubriformis TaxID=6319 RepID=A0AAN8IUU7_TRICO